MGSMWVIQWQFLAKRGPSRDRNIIVPLRVVLLKHLLMKSRGTGLARKPDKPGGMGEGEREREGEKKREAGPHR